MSRNCRVACAGLAWFVCLLVVPLALAQEEKPAAEKGEPAAKAANDAPPGKTDAPAKAEAAAEPAPAGEKKEPAAEPEQPAATPPAERPARAAFQTKLEAWKDVMKRLRGLRKKASVAEATEIAELQKQWDGLLAEGNKLLPEARSTALAAFAEAPNEDREVTQFLLKVLNDELARDEYEAVVTLAKTLYEAKCDARELAVTYGLAAYALNDFDTAKKVLVEAETNGQLTDALKQRLQQWGLYRSKEKEEDPAEKCFTFIDEQKELFTKEAELRAADEKANDLPRVEIETTKGKIVIELFENEAPQTVANFVSLVQNKFYDGLKFHRVLPGFMAQGGCPQGDGFGGPGYKIYDELDPKADKFRRHFRGALSMANSGPDTGGSQFFLTFRPTPELNGKHTVFGRVVEGFDVLAKIQRIDPQNPGRAIEPDKIVKASVLRKREHDYAPVKVSKD